MERFRYSGGRPGADPLAPPFDANAALRELGREMLGGASAADALRTLLRRGVQGLSGLDGLAERARGLRAEAAARGRPDGVLRRARAALDRALAAEREALAADPSDEARLHEIRLASLPGDTAAALRELAAEPYRWRSAEAERIVRELLDGVRGELVAARLGGGPGTPGGAVGDPVRIARMAHALAALLEAGARGEETDVAAFLAEFGDFFPADLPDLDAIVDLLARRAAAARRLASGLPAGRRAELAGLLDRAAARDGLVPALDRLADALLAHRPDLLEWAGSEDPLPLDGPADLGLAEAVAALDEIADLAALEEALERAGAPGARPGAAADVDRAALARRLGAQAAADLDRLAGLERTLRDRGHLAGTATRPRPTPAAVRLLGEAALRDLAPGSRRRTRRGGHPGASSGDPGDPAGGVLPWEPGCAAPLDAVATVRAALLRSTAERGHLPGAPTPGGAVPGGSASGGAVSGGAMPGGMASGSAVPGGPVPGGALPRIPLAPQDLRAAETDFRASAAVCLLVDLSYSMVRGGLLGPAREAALALCALAESRYPEDSVTVIGFDEYARVLRPGELVEPLRRRVQGSNVQHALRLAGAQLDRRPGAAPIVVAVTDGEPTAHLRRDGTAAFAWPPTAETAAATAAELDRIRDRGAALTLVAPGGAAPGALAAEVRARGGRVVPADPTGPGRAVLHAYASGRR
ncbi:VWA domain-containing protein [Nocardiopsis potens]|uniref:VWA domain-containing protein n=1 Tax=Nocardiopsis potens TaxID=1246458 RepID=UPI000346FF76|nr:VWA domain-containing protein [Nocardiopsis potens]